MTSKNLLRKGTNDSFSLDLEDVLNEEHLPFSFLIDKNRDARYYEDFLTKYQAIAFDNKYNRLIKEGHDIAHAFKDTLQQQIPSIASVLIHYLMSVISYIFVCFLNVYFHILPT